MEHKLTQINNSKTIKFYKYFILAVIVAVALRYIPSVQLTNEDILYVSAIAGIALAILDRISPAVRIKGLNSIKKEKFLIEGL